MMLSVTELQLSRVPISTLISFMEAVSAHPHADIQVIARFAGGLSRTTAKRAIPSLEALGIVKRAADGRYVCAAEGVRRGIDGKTARLIIRRSLQGYRPFEAVCEGLALGESEEEAIRRAGIISGLVTNDALRTLIGWGEELGILQRSDGSLRLAPEIAPQKGDEFGAVTAEEVESEARARLYAANRLGRDANQFLDATDRALLAEALLKYSSDPPTAVEKSGQALEDYLREVAKDRGLEKEAKSCNGAGQLGTLLSSKGIIHSHHNHFIQAVATARTTTAHRKDKKTMRPWDISPQGAFWSITGALAVIRSVHEYVYGGKQAL